MTINGVEHKKIIGTGVLFSVCCVCQKLTGVKSSERPERQSGGLSHGYCTKCFTKLN